MKNLETNKLIADFMGARYDDNRNSHKSSGYYFEDIELEYDTSWDWLMEVVEKIELIEDKSFTVDFCHSYVQIQQYGKHLNEIVTTEGGDRKENLYNACVEFIKWYNENKEVN